MNRFRQGMLIGLIVSVLLTLVITVTLDDERRHQLSKRVEKLLNALPGSEQLKQSVQETATRVQKTGSDLGEQVQESAGQLVQHTQEILSSAQKKAASLGTK